MNWCRRLLAHIILRVIWWDGGIIHMVDAIVGMLCEAARCCWWSSELVSLRVVRTTRSVRRRWRIVIIAVVVASVVVFWRRSFFLILCIEIVSFTRLECT
jgi:hypothetical protein